MVPPQWRGASRSDQGNADEAGGLAGPYRCPAIQRRNQPNNALQLTALQRALRSRFRQQLKASVGLQKSEVEHA